MDARQKELADLQMKLSDWLQEKMPRAGNLTISRLSPPSAGMSNETLLFDVNWEEAGRPRSQGMVFRTSPRSDATFPDYDMRKQVRIMQALEQKQVPVPKVLWLEEDIKMLGVPFYIMSKIEGNIPLSYPSYHTAGFYCDATPAQRAKIWFGALEAMAELHKLDWKDLGLNILDIPKGGTDPIDRQLAYWEGYLDWARGSPDAPQPVLRESLEWLKKNHYVPERVTLCWGDARLLNTIFSSTTNDLLALLDWEMAYIGDPESDLGWFLFQDRSQYENYNVAPLEGTPTIDMAVKRYEEVTGCKVRNLFYNDVLAAFRYAAILYRICTNQKRRGVSIPAGFELNNPGTQRLAALLKLPLPGPSLKYVTDIKDQMVKVQFHLDGSVNGDFYVLVDKGQGKRHIGVIANPDMTVNASAEDWACVERGDAGSTRNLLLSNRLKIDGDMSLLMQLLRNNCIPKC